MHTNNEQFSCCRHFHSDKYFLGLLQVLEPPSTSTMDFSDMDSDAEEEEEERRMREMEDILYSQIHHQEECEGSAAIEDVSQQLCDIASETKQDSPTIAQVGPGMTEEVVNAADSGVASLAASSPEPEFVDLASSDSDDDGIQG